MRRKRKMDRRKEHMSGKRLKGERDEEKKES